VQGSVDAWSTREPHVSQEEVLFKSRRVVTAEGLTPGLSFQIASPEPIRDKRSKLRDFVQRLAAARAWSPGNVNGYAETWGKLMNIPDSVVADEQKTIDLYLQCGLISRKLDASDIVDRSFSAAIAKGASL
jgi:sulfonate transport system substrate-binding protein